jgi:hypothetical protein
MPIRPKSRFHRRFRTNRQRCIATENTGFIGIFPPRRPPKHTTAAGTGRNDCARYPKRLRSKCKTTALEMRSYFDRFSTRRPSYRKEKAFANVHEGLPTHSAPNGRPQRGAPPQLARRSSRAQGTRRILAGARNFSAENVDAFQ